MAHLCTFLPPSYDDNFFFIMILSISPFLSPGFISFLSFFFLINFLENYHPEVQKIHQLLALEPLIYSNN